MQTGARLKWAMCGVLGLAALSHASIYCGEETSEGSYEETAKRKVFETILREDERGFTRKPPPKKGEWLYSFPERAESVERYKFLQHIRPTAQRRTISIQPLGEMNAEQTKLLEDLRDYAECFFQLPARIEKPIELKDDGSIKNLTRKVPISLRRGTYEAQFNADAILDHILATKVPSDAVTCLGITMQDLYSGELNYVFGLGSMNRRVGVYSLCRYFPEFWNQKRIEGSEKLALLRSCKVLNHEAGHMFGLPHCVFYNCSMNGSISLQETDSAPVHFCPVCHRKLLWNIEFDPNKRFSDLEAFYKKHGLADEAAFMAQRAKNWRQVEEIEKGRKQKDE